MQEIIDRESWKPEAVSFTALQKFIKARPGIGIADQYLSAIEELFLLRNPQYRFDKNYQADFQSFLQKHTDGKSAEEIGAWFYFPWLHQIIHYLPEELHVELKTGRNKNLITKEEQKRYYQSAIGILGMSVGSHVALTIGLIGGVKHIKLADLDIISASNLNRIRSGFPTVGLSKVKLVARMIFEMNPYTEVEIYPNGATEENLEDFLVGKRKLDVLVEEMDNPYFKIKARYLARERRIPIIMAADNGDNIIVDVERFDLSGDLPILHGMLGDMTPEDFKNVPPQDLPRTIAKMAGANIATLRMQESVLEVGKTLYSWPQLGTAATLCGATLAYLSRKIILGDDIQSGRYQVNLDSIFEHNYGSPKQEKSRKEKTEEFLKKLGITY